VTVGSDAALWARSAAPPCEHQDSCAGRDRTPPPRLRSRFGGNLVGVRRELIGGIGEELDKGDAGIVDASVRPVWSCVSLRPRPQIRGLEHVRPERTVEALEDRKRESPHPHVLVLVGVRIDLDTPLLQEDADESPERVEVEFPVAHAESVRLLRAARNQRPATSEGDSTVREPKCASLWHVAKSRIPAA
jgi:hypothetical protein